MSNSATATRSRAWGGVLAAVLSVVAALSFIIIPPAARASSSDTGSNTVTYWTSDQTGDAPYQAVADLDALKVYYNNPPDRTVSPETIEAMINASNVYKGLYDADPSLWTTVRSTLWYIGRLATVGQIPRYTEQQAQNFLNKAKSTAATAVQGKIDSYVSDLEAAKKQAPDNAARIDKLIENLNAYKSDSNFDPTNPDVAASIAAATALKENPNAKPQVPGFNEQPQTDPKDEAAKALQAQAGALRALLEANPADSKNLSTDERATAQKALDKADAALQNLSTQTAESLKTLTDETKTATDTANNAINANKASALSDVNGLKNGANAVLNDSSVPQELKDAVSQDLAKAADMNAHPEKYTVAQMEELRNKTLADINAARKASSAAGLDAAIAKLQELINNNGTETQNLKPAELEAAKKALADANAAKADTSKTADDLKAAATAANNAYDTASDAIKANKQAARDDLNKSISEANTLSGDPNLPAADKEALTQAIADAQAVANNTDATVKELKDAKDKLDAQIAAAKQARDNALKDAALADLDQQIKALEKVLSDNPAESKNLTDAQHQAAEAALQAAKDASDTAAGKTLQEIKDATAAAREAATNASSQVSANLNNAKTELDNEIKNATALLNYDGQNALTQEEKQALQDAIDAAKKVRDQDPVTVARLGDALNDLRDAKNTAIKEMKERAEAALKDAIKTLESTLDANPAGSENLTDEQRTAAQDKLNELTSNLGKVYEEDTTLDAINGWTTDALSTTSTVNQQVAANKQQPIADLDKKIAELENYLAAHPASTNDLTDAQRQDAKKALEDAKQDLAAAKAGTKSVKDIKAATDAADKALTNAQKAVTDNRAASRDKLDQALTAAQELLKRDDLTADTRKALQDAVAGGQLGEGATVAQLDAATDALNAAIKQAAVDDLDKQIEDLNQVLTDNSAESKNLTADQRAEAEKALADAQAVKKAAADKPADEINQAADAAKQAVSTATTAVNNNKAAAKRNLDAEITNAKAVSDSDIPAEAKQKLDEAIAAAKAVSDNRASTVADMEQALSTLREANNEAAKAGEDAKAAAKASLTNAVKALEDALKANPEESKNLTDEQRAAAEKALAAAKDALEGADNSKTEDVQAAANAALDALNTLNNNVAANKVEPTKELAASVQALEDFLAAHPAEGKDLTDEQRAAADKALAAAKKALADAEAGTLSVADIEAAAKAADAAAAAGDKQVKDNRAAARAAYEAALAKAKELLARTDLTAASRKALQAVVDGSSLADDATVADIEAATKALTDAIDAVEYVKASGLAHTGANLAALPLALALMAGGVLVVRRRRQQA